MGTRTYCIIGCGAVGGLYGSRLQAAGFDVHFLLNTDFQHVKQNGLFVESINGDIRLPRVNACNSPDAMPPCDVLIVAVKATQNRLFPQLLKAPLKKDGFVLLLQNGLGGEEQVAAVVGPGRVVGGMPFLCSYKVGPGHIRHLDYGKVKIAEYTADGSPGGITPRMEQLCSDFQLAGFEMEPLADLVPARWMKLTWNVPFNGLSVILNAETDELMKNENSRALVEKLMQETLAGAKAFGRTIPESFVQTMLADTLKMKPYKPSMRLDYESRKPMEVEAIYGNPVRAAASRGVSLPHTETLYRQLKFLDARGSLSVTNRK
jgi:2-dehydropantoate 2-reductase